MPQFAEKSTEQVLHERARALASPVDDGVSPGANSSSGSQLHIVRFEYGLHQFAIERHFMVQVAQCGEITPLPATPRILLGLVNLRGKILPVYNLLQILGYTETGITDSHQLLHVNAEDIDVCFLVDKVSAAEALPLSDLQPAANNTGASAEEFILGITSSRLVVVDVAAILGSHAIVIQHSEV